MTFSSIYTHIPFCVSKCNYCDFISFPVDNHHSQLRKYASLLDKDMAKWALREDFSQVETVYFGGGTPTVLATGDLLHLVSGISSMCNLQEDNEFTIECNPGTIDERNLLRLRQSGVNRLSVGAESFNDQVLQYMGRIYRAEDCLKLLKNARHAGFDNLSIDLIYGLPGQTVEQWLEDLNRALDLDIDHISVYGLTIPDNTPWGKAVAAGRMQMPDIDISADMLEISIKSIKEAGFEHYEVSNFAKKGHRCRHNMGYWQRNDY
ncbi:MAG: radical SAM family heme chaperone HemW, partial [Clostridiales bacterium]